MHVQDYPYPMQNMNEMVHGGYQNFQQPERGNIQSKGQNPIESRMNRLFPSNVKIEDGEPIKSSGQKSNRSKRKGPRKKSVDPLGTNILSDSKPNSKNTYINKINTLINDDPISPKTLVEPKVDEIKKTVALRNAEPPKNFAKSFTYQTSAGSARTGVKKVRSFDALKSDNMEDKFNEKLAKNRESARNSRKRKKIYIELLEKKIDDLTQELNSTKKQLDSNVATLDKATKNSQIMNNMIQGKQQLFSKLEKMLTSQADETEVNFLLDSLRLRLGATGSERERAIDFFFNQILDILLPTHMKYLLMTSSEGKDIFSSKFENRISMANVLSGNLSLSEEGRQDTTEFWNELIENLNLTEMQKKEILKYRKKLATEKHKFESIIKGLNNGRRALLKQSNSLQSIIDEFRQVLNPIQVGKALIILDKGKNRKELDIENLWKISRSGRNSDEDYDHDEGEEEPDSFESETNVGETHQKRQHFEAPTRIRPASTNNPEFLRGSASDVIRKKIRNENP